MKKRILSLLLTLVMILGMIPATAPAAQATSADTIIGVIFDAGGYKDHGSSYYLADSTVDVKLASGQIGDYSFLLGPLYTDEAGANKMKSEPELDKTYYFSIFIVEPDVDYNITNANSSIHVNGFHGGRILTSEIDGLGDLWIRCSITYGSLTGGVKAIASGVEYDSAEGGYAPNFTTLKAVSTEGKELEHTMVDGKYSYYGAKSGCLYKTNKGTSFSNMLTTEPQGGETYYSYFLLDSIDANLNIEEDLVDIRIPSYDVEYIDSYERDGGFTSLVVYSVTKTADARVYVGGVGMYDGDYLAVGATTTQTTKPSGGYAYYENGVLTLNNYSYEGEGYLYNSSKGWYAVIYAEQDLSINLIGNNTFTQTDSNSDMIHVDGANLTVGGDGKLTGTSGYALYADKDITINGGTVEVSAYYECILSYRGDVIINDGDITAESEDRMGIYSYYGVTVNGGNVTATGGTMAIRYHSSYGFTVAEGMNIQASTTVDGELGEYVAANNKSYKKIVIKPAASNITVNCIGDIDYTVSGNVVTVDHEVACKVGYLDGTAYKAITAVANGDGTYSFTAPAGVTEVLLVVKGDVSSDGRVNMGDVSKLYAHIKGTNMLTGVTLFMADISDDGRINMGDVSKLYAHIKGTNLLTWDT